MGKRKPLADQEYNRLTRQIREKESAKNKPAELKPLPGSLADWKWTEEDHMDVLYYVIHNGKGPRPKGWIKEGLTEYAANLTTKKKKQRYAAEVEEAEWNDLEELMPLISAPKPKED
jgi:hypothetical protein